MEKVMTVKALKSFIAESSNEFKAVLGPSVEKDNKTNNGKAYSDAKKRAKDYDGGLTDTKKKEAYEKLDGNKTTLDYTPENVTDDYKKRVHAQVKGYNSVQEMENDIEKQDDYSNNDNIYNGIKKSGKEMHKNEEDFKASGLQASKMPKETFKKEEMYESKDGFDMRNLINTLKESSQMGKRTFVEQSSVKTVYFKKTSFLNEGHMISRIPDEFKNEGTQFKMKDKHGTEYLVEWADGKANILNRNHKQKVNETLNAYDKLSNYTGEEYNTSNGKLRVNEGNSEIERMLGIVRKINDKN
jgi:hypothetical protein